MASRSRSSARAQSSDGVPSTDGQLGVGLVGPSERLWTSGREQEAAATSLWHAVVRGVEDGGVNAVGVAPVADSLQLPLQNGQHGRASPDQAGHVLQQERPGTERIHDSQQSLQRACAWILVAPSSVLGPLGRHRERLARRPGGDQVQFAPCHSKAGRRQFLGGVLDAPATRQSPIRSISAERGADDGILLDTMDGAEAGVLQAEIQPAHPGEERQDLWPTSAPRPTFTLRAAEGHDPLQASGGWANSRAAEATGDFMAGLL